MSVCVCVRERERAPIYLEGGDSDPYKLEIQSLLKGSGPIGDTLIICPMYIVDTVVSWMCGSLSCPSLDLT